jgi:plastocyanin
LSRHRFIPTAVLVAAAVALVLAVAGCASNDGGGAGSGGGTATTAGGGGGDDGYGGGGETTTSAGAAGGGSGSGETALTAKGFAWSETNLSLPKSATTLKVVNEDSAEHSFTAESINVDQDVEGGEDADVALDLSGASGAVNFKCKYHPSMTGVITVTG